jgi:hypothetical protein
MDETRRVTRMADRAAGVTAGMARRRRWLLLAVTARIPTARELS